MKAAAIKKKKADSDPLERHYTHPDDATEVWEILERLGLAGNYCPVAHLLDPCCGEDVFVAALPLSKYDCTSVSIDIDTLADADYPGYDFLGPLPKALVKGLHRVTHVVSNPPFSKASAFVERSRALCPDAVIAFLLPVSYLGAKERARGIHTTHRPTHIVHLGRMNFGGPAAELRRARAEAEGKKPSKGAGMDYVLVCWVPGVGKPVTKFYWKHHLLAPAPLFEGI